VTFSSSTVFLILFLKSKNRCGRAISRHDSLFFLFLLLLLLHLLLLLLPYTVVILLAFAAVAVVFVADVIIDVALFPRNTLSMHTCNFRILFAMVLVREVTPGHSPYMASLRSL
jgi:hypothetical protein